MKPETVAQLLAKAEEAKNTLLEATDLFHELDEQLVGACVADKRQPKGNTSPHGLVRCAHDRLRRADMLALKSLDAFMSVLTLKSLDAFMSVLTLLQQALTGTDPCLLLVCLSCGVTVRITERLAKEVAKPQCVACAGDLVAAERAS